MQHQDNSSDQALRGDHRAPQNDPAGSKRSGRTGSKSQGSPFWTRRRRVGCGVAATVFALFIVGAWWVLRGDPARRVMNAGLSEVLGGKVDHSSWRWNDGMLTIDGFRLQSPRSFPVLRKLTARRVEIQLPPMRFSFDELRRLRPTSIRLHDAEVELDPDACVGSAGTPIGTWPLLEVENSIVRLSPSRRNNSSQAAVRLSGTVEGGPEDRRSHLLLEADRLDSALWLPALYRIVRCEQWPSDAHMLPTLEAARLVIDLEPNRLTVEATARQVSSARLPGLAVVPPLNSVIANLNLDLEAAAPSSFALQLTAHELLSLQAHGQVRANQIAEFVLEADGVRFDSLDLGPAVTIAPSHNSLLNGTQPGRLMLRGVDLQSLAVRGNRQSFRLQTDARADAATWRNASSTGDSETNPGTYRLEQARAAVTLSAAREDDGGRWNLSIEESQLSAVVEPGSRAEFRVRGTADLGAGTTESTGPGGTFRGSVASSGWPVGAANWSGTISWPNARVPQVQIDGRGCLEAIGTRQSQSFADRFGLEMHVEAPMCARFEGLVVELAHLEGTTGTVHLSLPPTSFRPVAGSPNEPRFAGLSACPQPQELRTEAMELTANLPAGKPFRLQVGPSKIGVDCGLAAAALSFEIRQAEALVDRPGSPNAKARLDLEAMLPDGLPAVLVATTTWSASRSLNLSTWSGTATIPTGTIQQALALAQRLGGELELPTLAQNAGGSFSTDLEWGLQPGRFDLTGHATLSDLNGTLDDTHLFQGFAAQFDFVAALDDDRWAGSAEGKLAGGLVLWDSWFFDYTPAASRVTARFARPAVGASAASSAASSAPSTIVELAATLPGSGTFTANFEFPPPNGGQDIPVRSSLHIPDLSTMVEKSLLEPTAGSVPALEGLVVGGTVSLSSEAMFREGQWALLRGHLSWQRGSLFVPVLGVRAGDLELELPLELPGAAGTPTSAKGPARLAARSLEIAGLRFSDLETGLDSGPSAIAFAETLAVPVMGGTAELRDVEIVDPYTSERRIAASLALRGIDLRQLSEQMEWAPIDGTLNVRLPRMTIDAERFQIEGTGAMEVFGGTVQLQELTINDPLSRFPRIRFSAGFRDVDLRELTSTFEFGEITGSVDGYFGHCELFAGTPVRCEGRIASQKENSEPRRVSIRAVNNLSVVGNGSAIPLLNLLPTRLQSFRYKGLGAQFVLDQDRFLLRGTETRNGRELFLRGSTLPIRLDIVNVRPGQTVSFRTMTERIQNLEVRRNAPTPARRTP